MTSVEETEMTGRKTTLGWVSALAIATALGGGVAAAQSKEVVMQDPGGAYGEALRRVMYDPFQEATGIEVLIHLRPRDRALG
jgi:putative spermidine/putrescine transport system substrate-binding protein